MDKKISFIGLGAMGGPMAINIIKKGIELFVYDIDENKKNEFKSMLDKALSKDSELSFHVNPKLLGGIRLRVGNELIDASLINHLNKLRHEMLGAK